MYGYQFIDVHFIGQGLQKSLIDSLLHFEQSGPWTESVPASGQPHLKVIQG
jgi:hypothetical protein